MCFECCLLVCLTDNTRLIYRMFTRLWYAAAAVGAWESCCLMRFIGFVCLDLWCCFGSCSCRTESFLSWFCVFNFLLEQFLYSFPLAPNLFVRKLNILFCLCFFYKGRFFCGSFLTTLHICFVSVFISFLFVFSVFRYSFVTFIADCFFLSNSFQQLLHAVFINKPIAMTGVF